MTAQNYYLEFIKVHNKGVEQTNFVTQFHFKLNQIKQKTKFVGYGYTLGIKQPSR